MISSFSLLGAFLLGLEAYHTLAHFLILFGVRLLPRKDLVRLRYYFLVDTLSVFLVSFLYLRQLQWLAVLQMIQHGFYIVTWEISGPAKKVISWSSLDWTHSEHCPTPSRWQWDLILGTGFDMCVHLVLAVGIARHLTPLETLTGVVLMCIGLGSIIFNKRFAWSSPEQIPAWIKRRLRPVPSHKHFWPPGHAATLHDGEGKPAEKIK